MVDEKYVVHGPRPIIPLTNDSLGKVLFDSLQRNKHLPFAITDGITGNNLSYNDILNRSCSLAIYLQKYGLKENDVVTIISENNLEYVCPILASLYLGVITSAVNPNYKIREIQNCLNISQPTVAFCTEKTVAATLKVKQDNPLLKKVILIDTDKNLHGLETLHNICTSYPEEAVKSFRPINVNAKEHVAFIQFSSGTTGLPKGVLQTHKNYIAIQGIFKDHRYNRQFEPGTEAAIAYLPFFHGYGLNTLLLSTYFGRRIVVLKQFNERTFLECLQNYKITDLHVVPTIMNFLAKSPLVDKYDLSSIKEVICGAAALTKETESEVKRKLNVKIIRQAYGLTESTFSVIIVPFHENKFGSSGKILPYCSIKVIDLKSDKSLEAGKAGEIYVKGEMVMKGYVKNEEATRLALSEDGWLATGDIGYYDSDGYFYIVDRKKDLIKYKGYQVAPAELEGILLTHPSIKETGVVGVPDEAAGELPMAFVVLQPGKIISENEICSFVASEVSSHKRLRGGVKFISELPKSPSGKVLRRELRNLVIQKSKL